MTEQRDFARFIADLLEQRGPKEGSLAADLQAALARDGYTRAGKARLLEQLRATPPHQAQEK